jgi:hypothetical protein
MKNENIITETDTPQTTRRTAGVPIIKTTTRSEANPV